jgi:orotidine-5'-phosphate decarboxylase
MDKLLVALDLDTVAEARLLADRLRGVVGGFKIGSRLFTSHGPNVVEQLVARGDRVFLDLKFHDIPNTVAGAVAAATRLGVWMVNVHAAGGFAMMRAARSAADEEAARTSSRAPLLIAVTMLTSLAESALAEIGMTGSIAGQVERLAALAQSSGFDGVVASPQEIGIIRNRCGDQFAIVTPGIRGGAVTIAERGEGVPAQRVRGAGVPGVIDDQTRTMSAREALSAGATYLVVGRPIIAAPDPRAAAEQIAAECRA